MHSTRWNTIADIATRVVAVLTVAGLAGLAATISYRHMVLLAHRHAITGIDAHAFPLCTDGLDLIGVLVLLADQRAQRPSGRIPWTVLAVGTTASVAANVAVAPADLIARAITGSYAIALVAAAKMLAHLFEATRTPTTTPPPSADLTMATHEQRASDTRQVAPPVDIRPDKRGRPRRDPDISAGRRVPTSPGAYARWYAIWQATSDQPNATRDQAHAHGVSLRTLQFIRAAGEAGHLTPPPNGHTDPTPPRSPLAEPAAQPGAADEQAHDSELS